jgi:hypothetical protein
MKGRELAALVALVVGVASWCTPRALADEPTTISNQDGALSRAKSTTSLADPMSRPIPTATVPAYSVDTRTDLSSGAPQPAPAPSGAPVQPAEAPAAPASPAPVAVVVKTYAPAPVETVQPLPKPQAVAPAAAAPAAPPPSAPYMRRTWLMFLGVAAAVYAVGSFLR